MLSVARSRLALAVQLAFLGLHGIGLLLGTIYTYNTPQLYENNSHDKVGWIVTWVIVIQCTLGVIRLAVSIGKGKFAAAGEDAALLVPTSQVLERHEGNDHQDSPESYNRYSGDSGHFTATDTSRSHSVSSMPTYTQEAEQKKQEYGADHEDVMSYHHDEKRGLLENTKVEHLATKLSAKLSRRIMRVIDTLHNFADRTILLMGFIAFVSGAVVYGGVFVRKPFCPLPFVR